MLLCNLGIAEYLVLDVACPAQPWKAPGLDDSMHPTVIG